MLDLICDNFPDRPMYPWGENEDIYGDYFEEPEEDEIEDEMEDD